MRTIIKSKQAKHNPKENFIIGNPEMREMNVPGPGGGGMNLIGVSNEERHHLIAEAAYFRAEQRSFAPGHELEDWLAAEVDIETRLRSLTGN